MMIDLERRKFFRSRVREEGEHLIWAGSKGVRNYGIIYMGDDNERVYAHRVSYCISKRLNLSDIDDLIILKTCPRHDCVAPKHLASKPKPSDK